MRGSRDARLSLAIERLPAAKWAKARIDSDVPSSNSVRVLRTAGRSDPDASEAQQVHMGAETQDWRRLLSDTDIRDETFLALTEVMIRR